MALMDTIKKSLKDVKLDQEELHLLTVAVRHDAERSRLVLKATSEVGLNLPGDTMEAMVANLFGIATGDGVAGN